jgi:hypothetical protein
MGHFAEVDRNNTVVRIVLIDQETINTGKLGSPDRWIETSTHTRGGKHYDQDGVEDDGVPLRYNYAGIGMTYDKDRDAFIPQQPYPSWVLNDDTCEWDAPTPYPDDDKRYDWDEDTTSWKEIE